MNQFSAKGKRRWSPANGTYLVLMLIMKVMSASSRAPIIPKCPSEGESIPTARSYCKCNQGAITSGAKISIECDFGHQEDVVLTEDLYPFNRDSLMQAYVRVQNATSLRVTEGFLGSIQASASIALDIWRSGEVTFESSPPSQQNFPPSFSTFIGIGIINCSIPSLPKNLLRDRAVGGLLIRGSDIGTISPNFLFNIGMMRYLRIEDSVVVRVEGPISSRGPLSMGSASDGICQGFKILNSDVADIGPSAFNFVYEAPGVTTCEAKIVNNRLGNVASGAITTVGKMDVIIQGNTFQHLQKDALKVNVSGSLKFDQNVVEMLEPGGLKSLMCGNNTSMEKNTIHMKSPHDQPYNSSTIPFESSCRITQVFLVMSPPQPQTLQRTSNATWVLLAFLLVVVGGLAFGGLYIWRNHSFNRQYRRGGVPIGLGFPVRTTMQELHNSTDADDNDDDDDDQDDTDVDTGVSNPVFGIKEPSNAYTN